MSSFLWVRCPEAATWQRVKEMAKRHPHKWDMEADGTLIAALFTAVEVLPHCYIEVRNYVCFTFHSTVGHKQTSPERSSWSVSVVLNKHSDRKYPWWFFGANFKSQSHSIFSWNYSGRKTQAEHIRTLGALRKQE